LRHQTASLGELTKDVMRLFSLSSTHILLDIVYAEGINVAGDYQDAETVRIMSLWSRFEQYVR